MAKFIQCIREDNECEYAENIYAIKNAGFDSNQGGPSEKVGDEPTRLIEG